MELMEAIKHGSYDRQRILGDKSHTRLLPLLPASNLRSIVESVYRQEQGASVTDQHHFAYSYIHRISSNSRSALKVFTNNSSSSSQLLLSRSRETSNVGVESAQQQQRSKFSQEMEKLLQDCVLWDTNSLGSSFQDAMDLLSSDTSSSVGVSSITGENRAKEQNIVTSSSSSSSLTTTLLPFQPELSFSLIRTAFQAFDAPLRTLHQTVRTHPAVA